jgi:hypothetical protein
MRSARCRRAWDDRSLGKDSTRRIFSSGQASATGSHASKEEATSAPSIGRIDRPLPRPVAKELGPRRIRVNAINPGMVEQKTQDVAPAVAFLRVGGFGLHHRRNELITGGLR